MPATIPNEAARCLDDEALLAFTEGGLSGDALLAVDAHLDACPACRELVAALGDHALTASRTRASTARAEGIPAAATEVGRFRVTGPIGEGAMGIVLAAYDPELDRKVAIKLLHADGGDARRRARLAREAKALARLSHPNVVTVHDVGAHEDGVYVAMELVDGSDLRTWLAAAKRSPEEVLAVLLQAGEGLAAAHDAGLIHRDFKPENVLVERTGRAKVSDFGLAREASGGPDYASFIAVSTEATLTHTGALLGTPAYMAPEQLAGEVVGPAADQFAFASTVWEALEGTRPFAEATSVSALRARIAAGPPATPARISRRVQRALLRALAPHPRNRFPDLHALLLALAPPTRLGGWALAGALGLALVAALGTLALGDSAATCAPADALRAELFPIAARDALSAHGPGVLASLDAFATDWAAGRADACEATHVRREQSEARLDARVACLDRGEAAFHTVQSALRSSRGYQEAEILATLPDPRACASLDGRLAPPPARDRAAHEALGRAIDEARVSLAAARAPRVGAAELLARAEALAYPPTIAEAGLFLAASRAAEGLYDDALAAAREALLIAEAAADDRRAAESWLALTRVAGTAGRYAEAAAHARHAEAVIARAGTPVDLQDQLLRLRGVLATNLGRLDEAETDLREALRRADERAGAASPELAPIHTALGNLARLDGRFAAALEEHTRALTLDRAAFGGDHPRVARDLHNVAGILRHLERRREARARYLEALAIVEARLGPAHPDYGLTSNSLGLLAFEAGQDAEARAHWDRARTIFEAHAHGDLALVRYNLALLALREGHAEEAVEHARTALAIDTERLGPSAKRVGGEHLALGRALRALGQEREARDALGEALTIARALGDAPLETEAEAELAAQEGAEPPATDVARTEEGSLPRATPRRAPRRSLTVATPAPSPAARPEPTPEEVAPPPAPIPLRRTGSAAYGPGQPWE